MKSYIGLLFFALAATAFAGPTVVGSANPTVVSHWKGKKVAFLGDSITDPNHIGCTANYWNFLAESLGIDVYVYAISGWQMGGLIKLAEKLKADVGDEIDAIFILAGTNDYNGNIPIGEWYDIVETETVRSTGKAKLPRRILSMDPKTFRGRINVLLSYLKHNFTSQQIVMITSIHRGFATFGPKNIQPDESFPNLLGLYIDDYNDDIRKAGKIWSVPILDLFECSGLLPSDGAYAQFFSKSDTDMLHPNANGHARLASTMMRWMSAVPSDFKDCLTATPMPNRPKPSPAMAERIQSGVEVYGIVHWGLNTYTDREWGYGDEDPTMLNPTEFNADGIVEACAAGGLQGLIVVAKHHDGFCLWPTKTTEHNITKSPFRGGKGDYVKEMADACNRKGLGFGVYVSPWDRNNADYANAKYVNTFHEQVRELVSGEYGKVFEIWFDGANGGDGYYGGAREARKIGEGYYRFKELIGTVRKLQPKACIFAGELDESDFRWPGNERGELVPESRATICAVGGYANRMYGNPNYPRFINSGFVAGQNFRACEADFPLRKGWFFHAKDSGKTKHAAYLMNRYLASVGNGGTMNIGIAPNRAGVLDEEDIRALKGFKTIKDAFFSHKVDPSKEKFNVVVMQEDVSSGEMVDNWSLEVDCREVLSGRSIGIKRIRVLDTPRSGKCELVAKCAATRITISTEYYMADPELVKLVLAANANSEETDTAKWMTGVEKETK